MAENQKLKFKFSDSIEGKNPEDGDLVAINKAMNSSDTTTVNTKFGSIYKGKKILGTTESDKLVITKDIKVAGLSDEGLGAGINNGEIINAGTSVQDVLLKLLSKELYPAPATLPFFNLYGNTNLGVKEVGSEVTLPEIRMVRGTGNFNSSEATWSQPAVQGVTWSNEIIAPGSPTGFTNTSLNAGTTVVAASSAKVGLGHNSITYAASANYSAPTNKPKTNLDKETTKTSASAADGTATWVAGSCTRSVNTTATGVLPVRHNAHSTMLYDNPHVHVIQVSPVFDINVLSEVKYNTHFMFHYPTSHPIISFKIQSITGEYVDYDAPYEIINGITYTFNGINYQYSILRTTGPLQGGFKCRITLDKSLDQI